MFLNDGAYRRVSQDCIAFVHVVEQRIVRVDILEVVNADKQAMDVEVFTPLVFAASLTRSERIQVVHGERRRWDRLVRQSIAFRV